MAKKKGKRVDLEKKAALAAKKEAKAQRAAQKRLIKEARRANGEQALDDDDGADSDSDHSDYNNADLDVDQLLLKYQRRNAAAAAAAESNTKTSTATCKVVPLDGSFPLARANASFTLAAADVSKKNVAAYLFGGEYFDGVHNVVSDQLFKYELASGQWKEIVAPANSSSNSSPAPRCAHSAVYYNKSLYVFGGEVASTTEYHHFKDFWKFDTVKLQWTEITPHKKDGGSVPTARSGQAVTVWKNFMVLFGGFYEASDHAPRWFHDVYVFNLQTEQWLTIPHSPLTVRPEPRSACNAALVGNPEDGRWWIHGGFTKVLNRRSSHSAATEEQHQQSPDGPILPPASETKTHTDAWILHLKPLLQGKPPTWERWTSSLLTAQQQREARACANGRSGVAAAAYQGNVVLFAGVVDRELHHHKLDSIFYNDLSLFHVEKRKFLPIRIQQTQQHQPVSSEAVKDDDSDDKSDNEASAGFEIDDDDNDDETTSEPTGWDLEQLRKDMFAFRDGTGNTVYEKAALASTTTAGADSSSEEEEEEKEESKSDHRTKNRRRRQRSQSSEPTAAAADAIVERTEPLPRIKTGLLVHNHRLYVFGGLLEVGDREITLDDMWTLNLKSNKDRRWECLYRGTMHRQVWLGAEHDDDDSYYSNATGTKKDRDERDGDDGEPGEITDSDNEKEEKEEEKEEKEAKPKSKNKDKSNPKKETAELVQRFDLEDADTTPQPDESLAEFHARTADHWTDQAAATAAAAAAGNIDLSERDARRQGFALARARFEELQPVIARLLELKRLREQEKAERKKEKKSSKK